MTEWDISTAVFQNSKSVVSPSTHSPTGLFFRNDGLKMYVINNSIINGDGIGSTSNEIFEFNLSPAWDISTASLVQSFNVQPNTRDPAGIFFKPDGLVMFIGSANPGANRIFEYHLTTPWNISTASFFLPSQNLTDLPPNETTIQNIFIRSDGLKVYIVGSGTDKIHEFNLSPAWSLATGGLVLVQSFSVSAQDSFPDGVFFKPDGLKMFVSGATNGRIYEYNLSTAWNISTASFVQSKNVSTEDALPVSVAFKPDGTKMFHTGQTNGRVYSYDLAGGQSEPPIDAWNFREHKTATGIFNPNYTFQRESASPNRFQMISGGGSALGHGYLFKTFPISEITGSDIEVVWTDVSPFFGNIGISVYDGIYDPNSQTDFPDATTVQTSITLKGAGLLGSISENEVASTIFPLTTILPTSSINYNGSTTGFVTVFIVNFDSQQIPFSNLLFDSIDITTVAKYNFSNSQVTNVLTGTIRDWGFVGAGTITNHIITFCDDISTNTGWVKVGVNVGTRIFIDDPAFPDLIKLNLDGGGGSFPRYAYKDIGSIIGGNNIKLQFKLDYDAMGQINFPAVISVGLCSTTSHPQQQGTNSTIRVDLVFTSTNSIAMNGVVNDATTTKITSTGAINQHSLWIYPNSDLPVSDASLKGPYYVTVELKDNKLRLSAYKDSARTQHIRGSPITVDATGVNPTNLRYIMVGNDVTGGSEKIFQGSLDDFCVFQNSGGLEPIPAKPLPATGSFIETWEGFATGDQNPPPWISRNEIVGGINTTLIDIHEVSPEAPIEGSKAFKIHQKYQRISGSPSGRVSVSRFLPAIVRTDGSGLDIPLSLSAKMRADIISQLDDGIGVMVAYDLILGAPNITAKRAIFYKLYGTTGSTQVFIWNGTEWIFNDTLDVPISISLPATTVGEINSENIKDAFNNSAILSNTNGWDFESHITGVHVGYVGLNIASTISEVLIHGDTISMLNAGIGIKTFSIGAVSKGSKILESKVNAILIKEKTFTINALIPPIPATFEVNARIVRRTAVNSAIADAILLGIVVITTQTKPFLIDAEIKQPIFETFKVDGKLIRKQQKSFLIDGIITPIRAKTTKIDALVGIFEPMSILDVESVIGHEV